jgi:hypothetical protein
VDDQSGRDTAVLGSRHNRRIGSPGEDYLARYPEDLVGGAGPSEQLLLELRPIPAPDTGVVVEPGTRLRAQRTALDPVRAVIGPFDIGLEGLLTLEVVIQDVVGTDEDASGAAAANIGRDDLLEELFPLAHGGEPC